MADIKKVEDSTAAREFLENVQVFGRREGFESAEDLELPIPKFEDGTQQAITVGSQIAEFAKSVPEAIRPQIANSFLLAQLAANKMVAEDGTSKEWYERYVDVLVNIGWIIETETDSTKDVSGTSTEMHEEIIPIISAALGPAVAAAALVTKLLEGLKNMDKDSPWMTLFSKESQRATANQFQVSYAEVPDDKIPRITLTCFELDAKRSVYQVLFFKFSDTNAKLKYFGSKMNMNNALFEAVQDVVADRVVDYVKNYISAIPDLG